jgi:hypothetical protein
MAILKYFYDKEDDNHDLLKPNAWKRTSKTGSGDHIIRTFLNKITNTTILIRSSETRIYSVTEGAPSISNLIEYLRKKYNGCSDGFYGLAYEIPGDVTNWPQVKLEDEDETFNEPLDTENFEWISISDDEMVIACGGDWQEPLTLTIKLVNGKLTVTNSTEGYGNGMSEEQFLNSIK